MKNRKLDIRIILFFAAIFIFFIDVGEITKMFSIYMSEDETGYWGNAAALAGKNWGNATSYCPYYSYGYSLFLSVLLHFFADGAVLYRMAVLCNGLFMILSFYISYCLVVKLFDSMDKRLLVAACACTAFYPAFIVQSSIAWAECLIILFIWMIFYQAVILTEKMTALRSMVFISEIFFLYAIHQRMLAVLIAGLIFLAILLIRKVRYPNALICTLVSVLLMFIFVNIMKEWIINNVYTNGLIGNDYESVLNGFSLLSDLQGVILAVFGQLYYLGAASFLLIFTGIWMMVSQLISEIKKKGTKGLLYFFVLLSAMGTLGISAIMWRGQYARLDQLVYGRYVEPMAGIFLLFGIIFFLDKRKGLKEILAVISISAGALILFAIGVIYKMKLWGIETDSFQAACSSGIYWFVKQYGFQIIPMALIAIAGGFLLAGGLYIGKYKKVLSCIILLLLSACFIFQGKNVVWNEVYSYQTGNSTVFKALDAISDIRKENGKIYYINQGFGKEVSFTDRRGVYQMYFNDMQVICQTSFESIDKAASLIVGKGLDIPKEYEDKYSLKGFVSSDRIYVPFEIGVKAEVQEFVLDELGFARPEIPKTDEGYCLFGPYMTLPSGDYMVEIYFEENIGKKETGTADAVCKMGEIILDGPVPIEDGDNKSELHLRIMENTDQIEIRVYKHPDSVIKVGKVILTMENRVLP